MKILSKNTKKCSNGNRIWYTLLYREPGGQKRAFDNPDQKNKKKVGHEKWVS